MPKRTKAEAEALAKLVVHYHDNGAGQSLAKTCKHFVKGVIPENTIPNIVRRHVNENRIMHKTPNGRPCTVATQKVMKKVEACFKKNPNLSVRVLADRLGIARSTLSRMKV